VADETEDVADQEIAALEFAAVFVDDPADVQPLLKELLFVRAERLPEFLQVLQRRTAAQLEDDVLLRLRDDHVPSDGATALGNDGAQADVALQHDAHGALVARLAVLKQHTLARPADAAGHAAEHADAGSVFIHLAEERVDGKCERIADEKD